MRPRRLELDYIAAARRPRWPGLALLGVSLALAGHLALRYDEVRRELARLDTEMGLLAPQRGPARPLAPGRLDDQLKNAEAVVRQLTLPWGPLVGVLEQASTRDVALLQLQPDATQRTLRLTGEARDRAAMFEYVRRLSGAHGLGEVHLVSHQVEQANPQRPIQFSVQAVLR